MNWLLTSINVGSVNMLATPFRPDLSMISGQWSYFMLSVTVFQTRKDQLVLSTLHRHDRLQDQLDDLRSHAWSQTRLTNTLNTSCFGSKMPFFPFSDATSLPRELVAAILPSPLWQQLWMAGCPALGSLSEARHHLQASMAISRIPSAANWSR